MNLYWKALIEKLHDWREFRSLSQKASFQLYVYNWKFPLLASCWSSHSICTSCLSEKNYSTPYEINTAYQSCSQALHYLLHWIQCPHKQVHYPNFKQNQMPSQSHRQRVSTVQHLPSAYPFSRRRCLHHWKAECTGKIRIGSKIRWMLFYFLPCSITNELKHQTIRCFNILRTWVCSHLTQRKKNPINLKWGGSGLKQRPWRGTWRGRPPHTQGNAEKVEGSKEMSQYKTVASQTTMCKRAAS